MNKKITVKDVAREAGVSVATVSYIMNDRKDQKISEETRKKVLQIANLLNYKPSHAAKSLATGRNNIIGIAYTYLDSTPARNHEITLLVKELEERLHRMHYDVITLPVATSEEEKIPANRNIDGIIAIDLSMDQFTTLSTEYLVPVISVDMLVNDPLFFQIYTDYERRIKEAYEHFGKDAILIMDCFSNEGLQAQITSCLPKSKIILASELTSQKLKKLSEKNVIALGEYLGLALLPHVKKEHFAIISNEQNIPLFLNDITYFDTNVAKKANLTINILLNALDRNFMIPHNQSV